MCLVCIFSKQLFLINHINQCACVCIYSFIWTQSSQNKEDKTFFSFSNFRFWYRIECVNWLNRLNMRQSQSAMTQVQYTRLDEIQRWIFSKDKYQMNVNGYKMNSWKQFGDGWIFFASFCCRNEATYNKRVRRFALLQLKISMPVKNPWNCRKLF